VPGILENLTESVGVPVAATLPLGSDLIVLFDYHEASQKRVWDNLMRVRPDGTIVWRASPPTSTAGFTKIEWIGGNLMAWTWECFMLRLDPASGRVLESTFMK
jgi:hypothetical protein